MRLSKPFAKCSIDPRRCGLEGSQMGLHMPCHLAESNILSAISHTIAFSPGFLLPGSYVSLYRTHSTASVA